MELMKSRRLIMLAQNSNPPVPPVPTIGGLPVFLDNSRYSVANGLVDSVITDQDYFLTGVVDTGTTAQKRYTITRIGTGVNAALRMFNDISANSVDYWTIMRTDIASGQIIPYTFSSLGRYIIISVAKVYAAEFYIKDENGNYLLKGSNVTE